MSELSESDADSMPSSSQSLTASFSESEGDPISFEEIRQLVTAAEELEAANPLPMSPQEITTLIDEIGNMAGEEINRVYEFVQYIEPSVMETGTNSFYTLKASTLRVLQIHVASVNSGASEENEEMAHSNTDDHPKEEEEECE